MLYHLYDMQKASLEPLRYANETLRKALEHSYAPFNYNPLANITAASCEVFERITRRFGKPEFGIEQVVVKGKSINITEKVVLERAFCELLHFEKQGFHEKQPRVLLVAPLSGHHATLLRDTVRNLLENHDVYVTDWIDAREVPLSKGKFDFEDNIHYIMEFIRELGPNVHVIAVCQPSVQLVAAVALMAANKDKKQPRSMILMGGPIDTRINPSKVNEFAKKHALPWFENTMISTIPTYYRGAGRRIYPGFLQLTGFISLDVNRHVNAHLDFFNQLVQGDEESASAHRRFYDEYLSVMDMPADYFLQTIQKVFQDHDLPRGTLVWRGQVVDLKAICQTALMTIEGERDNISPPGQTKITHDLCPNIPAAKKRHLLQLEVGHYGIFNGKKWRTLILPKITEFIAAQEA